MASSLIPDPFQMWRDALTKMEGEVNTLATGSLKSNEVVRTMNQLASVTLGTQQMFEKVMESYLRRANLPQPGGRHREEKSNHLALRFRAARNGKKL